MYVCVYIYIYNGFCLPHCYFGVVFQLREARKSHTHKYIATFKVHSIPALGRL